MIAVDTNILVYAHRRDSPFHADADAVMRGLAAGARAWAIPWPCIHEFLSVVTHPRIYAPPSTLAQATAQIDAWLGAPRVSLLAEADDHWSRLRELMTSARGVGPLVHDGRIAALCLSHGIVELLSADRDFSRFPSLRVRNPFVPAR